MGRKTSSKKNRKGQAKHNRRDEIAEMLEFDSDQYDELSYEEVVFHRDVEFHDQHHEMRLDIDNMSYEQLLQLEENMGTVNTGISEEALASCIRKNIDRTDDDESTECSICQEGYEHGNEISELKCGHRYHAPCIERWLQLKNWCPICKASVAPFS